MRYWYAPGTDSTYPREEPGSPDHTEIAAPPSQYHRYDHRAGEWILPEGTMERIEAQRKRNEALRELAATDWRVIKAAEEYLAEQGEIDSELRDRRESLRSVAEGVQRERL